MIARRMTSSACFTAHIPQTPSLAHPGQLLCPAFDVRRPQSVPYCVCPQASAVVLGGSSGVGKEVVKYLESQSAQITVASRGTGYDFRNESETLKALHGQERAAISVGGGRRTISPRDELELYQTIAKALSSTSELKLVIVVLRALILPEVQDLFKMMVGIPWVLIRPGPLVDKEEPPELEKVLVTPDIRCNGLVSRAAVGRVVGDLLLEKVPVHTVASQVLGVYDVDRMINHPHGIEVIGKDIWQ